MILVTLGTIIAPILNKIYKNISVTEENLLPSNTVLVHDNNQTG
jgi:hypothetical protein